MVIKEVKHMGFIRWLFGSKEEIDDDRIRHASLGDYTETNRLKSGGHGQEAIDYMNTNNIEYNVVKTYKNGVRVGNVANHKEKQKKTGTGQSWFPKSWNRSKIKRAGQVVARGTVKEDGKISTGHYERVNIGIQRTNGKIGTIFPMNDQKNKKGIEINEKRKSRKANSKRKKH